MEYREIRIVNRREDVRSAAEMVECLAADFQIPRQVVSDVNVTLDEMGCPPRGSGRGTHDDWWRATGGQW